MKEFLKNKLPNFKEVSKIKTLQKLNIAQKYLWHFSRRSVSTACFVGFFWTMLPIPFQMIPATLTAIYARANLPITLVLVWISNPLTIPIIFLLNYRLGSLVLGIVPQEDTAIYSWKNIMGMTSPLLVGSLISGFFLGLASYWLVNWVYIVYVRCNQFKRTWRKHKGRINP